MSALAVNCCRMAFGRTLGVSHGLLRICELLARDHELTFVVDERSGIENSPAGTIVSSIATEVIDIRESAARAAKLSKAIELLPHHFQPSRFCERSIVICHDLHVFDVPWKYGNGALRLQNRFRRVLTGATAVTTPFPRTYYAVEQVAGISLANLFLLGTPLLIDTTAARRQASSVRARAGTTLLYPAQLQSHKNHQALIEAIGALTVPERDGLRMVFPGSDFADELTADLRALAASRGVAENIDFIGRVSDSRLVELYGECDAVIIPSLAEGGAYVALEAIAAGKPVAVNDIESARMHLDAMDGDVFWFDAASESSTVGALRQLLTVDPQVCFERNEKCRNRIANTTWDGVATKWNAIIDMLEGRRPRPVLRMDPLAREVEFA